MLNSIFRGLLGTEEAPTKVIEVRSDNYISRPIHYREDSILLYGPKSPNDGKNTKDKYFEICTVAILQKLCDTLSQHQSWTIAHMMAHFGLSEQFNDPEVQKHLDDIDPLTGATPLMDDVILESIVLAHFSFCIYTMCQVPMVPKILIILRQEGLKVKNSSDSKISYNYLNYEDGFTGVRLYVILFVCLRKVNDQTQFPKWIR
ncbi:hypothetical protein SFRURICE_019614 [Spodoptera frugiperda]|nr:hypothetical protein SFRURICE_019614 [Spodoptera frugiperda]